MDKCPRNRGFTLIETVMVILIIGVIATVATMRMGESMDTAKYDHTQSELNQIAYAIAGNPALFEEGSRSDFGYVGDVGALPGSLDDLVSNPGGFATWNGPYLNTGISGDDYKRDGWGVLYGWAGTTVTSSGSGSSIQKQLAPNSAWLLSNSIEGYVVDGDNAGPGSTFSDSVVIRLNYPDGAGATTWSTTNPGADGSFSISGVPVGRHNLELIYIPGNDTLSHTVTVLPGRTSALALTFPFDLW